MVIISERIGYMCARVWLCVWECAMVCSARVCLCGVYTFGMSSAWHKCICYVMAMYNVYVTRAFVVCICWMQNFSHSISVIRCRMYGIVFENANSRMRTNWMDLLSIMDHVRTIGKRRPHGGRVCASAIACRQECLIRKLNWERDSSMAMWDGSVLLAHRFCLSWTGMTLYCLCCHTFPLPVRLERIIREKPDWNDPFSYLVSYILCTFQTT